MVMDRWDVATMPVDEKGIKAAKECAAYCRKRAAMAWGEALKTHWRKLARKNEEFVERGGR